MTLEQLGQKTTGETIAERRLRRFGIRPEQFHRDEILAFDRLLRQMFDDGYHQGFADGEIAGSKSATRLMAQKEGE